MTEKLKDAQNQQYYGNQEYKNTFGEPSHLPVNYPYRSNTDDFYEEDNSGAGSFLLGALVGGVIGAAAALFLAPKTGKEMRDDFSDQAVHIKNKSIELSTVAKDKATEISAVAKEKTDELAKTIQEQSGQIVDKVKSMTNKTSVPMHDGTVSSEGEEQIEFVENKTEENKESADHQSTKNSTVAYDNSENIGEEKNVNQNHISVEKEK
ncbi:YtxH domain-containing protein [Sporosarcina thermotolerans]|uniref:YtxH domain-containing protein n=1 Tax=Sporosarcina thermotolerans TaxID=633404 RepID=A0AAW9A714_9BACL|nr:YtxH domain-containing protein [Sporosarcina thermotolerans]MDW0117152.1 YtxH domain-containing protein [Sporosarcina thermotolerans]WHT47769.1 YtxH domain-containing protein [Sporosarcina thermotolerans]